MKFTAWNYMSQDRQIKCADQLDMGIKNIYIYVHLKEGRGGGGVGAIFDKLSDDVRLLKTDRIVM